MTSTIIREILGAMFLGLSGIKLRTLKNETGYLYGHSCPICIEEGYIHTVPLVFHTLSKGVGYICPVCYAKGRGELYKGIFTYTEEARSFFNHKAYNRIIKEHLDKSPKARSNDTPKEWLKEAEDVESPLFWSLS